MRITAFRLPKPKQFEYSPRYYDPAKELMQEREKRILRELENETVNTESGYKPISKDELRHNMRFKRPARPSGRKGGILLKLITMIMALLVALLVFYGTWVLVRSL